jgi:hypothetical protein
MSSQTLLQDMIDIARSGKKPANTTSFAHIKFDEFTLRKISIPIILAWLFVQDFVGDTESTDYDVSFSSEQVVQLLNTSPELQKYFQIKDGKLAFAETLSEAEGSEMLKYVKQNYRPLVNF